MNQRLKCQSQRALGVGGQESSHFYMRMRAGDRMEVGIAECNQTKKREQRWQEESEGARG
eukprot:1571646-Pleurochrysis_carterae.AAC.1